ncbi:hypothetical protein [Streptomyces sp. NPDC048436]|uniref:hypothetical protein n=1 Tax=Streptomyces sp. NPDC048436 TaxID=3365550 RepID=UPI00371E355C
MRVYLIHIHLLPDAAGASLPADAGLAVARAAPEPAAVELAVVHDGAAHPVVALYLRSGSLRQAEEEARSAWLNAAASRPDLSVFILLRAEMPLLRLDD